MLPLERLCGCVRSCLPNTSFFHSQLPDHSPVSGHGSLAGLSQASPGLQAFLWTAGGWGLL